MNLIPLRLACVVVIGAALATSGCDSGSGGSDMNAMVNQMEQADRYAEEAEARSAAEAQAKAEAKAKADAAAARAAELTAQEKAAAEQAAAAENEMSVTITVKNPQALLNNEEAKAQAKEMMEEFGPTSGRRGQTFHGDGQGYLYAVFSARFVAENRVVMAQIKKNMDLFEATNGRKPASHEEFWQAIIVDGGVSLPELEEGEEYFYDVDSDTLMVKTPSPQ